MIGALALGVLGAVVGWLAGVLAVLVPEGTWADPAAFYLEATRERRMEQTVGALLGGASFAAAWVLRESRADALVTVLLLPLLISILLIDLRHHLVYPVMTLVAFALGLALNPLGGESTFLGSLVGGGLAAFGFLLFFLLGILLFRVHALGFGDVLLAGMIGSVVGVAWMPRALFLGTSIATLAAVCLLVFRRKGLRDYIPFGSGMCLGAIIVLLLRS